MTGKKNSGYRFLDMGAMGDAQLRELKAITDFEERNRRIMSITKEKWSQEDVLRTSKVSFLEEITCIATFFFGVPGAVFVFPGALCLVYSLWGVIPFVVCTTAFVSLSVMKAGLNEDLLTSWPAVGMVRYFSFKGIFSQLLEKDKPYILVAPPHGVFPFGNIMTMLSFPIFQGFSFRGAAASSALQMPVFRQILRGIGCVDASRTSLKKNLNDNKIVGISTGGVAEVFETDNDDETIILRERIGLIKLAITTGAPLVPCYLFGNTKLLSIWTGGSYGYSTLRDISRKVGFALILFWGRFGLPIPYRIPIVGALGPPIEVKKQDNPSIEYIMEVQAKLIHEMEVLFDTHKESYGWKDKKLVIK